MVQQLSNDQNFGFVPGMGQEIEADIVARNHMNVPHNEEMVTALQAPTQQNALALPQLDVIAVPQQGNLPGNQSMIHSQAIPSNIEQQERITSFLSQGLQRLLSAQHNQIGSRIMQHHYPRQHHAH